MHFSVDEELIGEKKSSHAKYVWKYTSQLPSIEFSDCLHERHNKFSHSSWHESWTTKQIHS